MKDWKSTAVGILSFFVTTLTVLSALLGGDDLSSGNGVSWHTLSPHTKFAIGVTILLALCRAWLGWIQNYKPALPPSVPPTSIATKQPEI